MHREQGRVFTYLDGKIADEVGRIGHDGVLAHHPGLHYLRRPWALIAKDLGRLGQMVTQHYGCFLLIPVPVGSSPF